MATAQHVFVPAPHLRTLTVVALAGAFVIGWNVGKQTRPVTQK